LRRRCLMRLIRNLMFEQYKNFRILLRNISSLLLLIIGPLALILLVGFAYSGEKLHDINIGVISSDYSVLQPAFSNFSSYANIIEYTSSESCVSDLRLYKTHVCLVFSSDFGKAEANSSGFVSGKITFYYDNSRKPLSDKVVKGLADYFGVEAEKISIESAKTVFSDIQDFVGYVESKNKDLNTMVDESQGIKLSLIERRERLVKMREEFLPVYQEIKTVQANLDNVSRRLDESYGKYNESYSELNIELRLLRRRLDNFGSLLPRSELYVYRELGDYRLTDNLSILLLSNVSYYNLSGYNYTVNLEDMFLNISGLNETLLYSTPVIVNLSTMESFPVMGLASQAGIRAIDEFDIALANFSGTGEEYYNYLNYQKKQFDAAVSLIDDVNLMLNADIEMTEEYIAKIGVAVVRVQETQGELNSTVKLFSRFDPSQAEKLITPFLKEYVPILSGIKNITQAYPGMIAIIVIFISILFANIVTLTEINSKAFYRNLLAPVNKLVFVFGLVMSIITIVFFQIFVLLLVGQLNFGIDVFGVFFGIGVVVTLLSLIFIALGMIIAILIRSEQSSVLTTTFVALGFFLFSDSVTPIEIMPKIAGFFASRNPYVVATLAFKKLIIFGMPLPLVADELMLLGGYLLVMMIVLVLVSGRRLRSRA
jgi:ABC-type multidrug transport system permease subunit